PSFSRATLQLLKDGAQLYLAGTASIVGHTSRHRGNPVKQARETVKNLQAVVRRVEIEEKLPERGSLGGSIIKVYIRHPSHYEAVQAELRGQLWGIDDVLFLQGDICRPELLLEIEGALTYSN
ncbi:MAG: hypothetical protein R3351_04575, partial [Nitrospirales bacterium]|nr:hypothetical protein [Nitrospirales bacterium]